MSNANNGVLGKISENCPTFQIKYQNFNVFIYKTNLKTIKTIRQVFPECHLESYYCICKKMYHLIWSIVEEKIKLKIIYFNVTIYQ